MTLKEQCNAEEHCHGVVAEALQVGTQDTGGEAEAEKRDSCRDPSAVKRLVKSAGWELGKPVFWNNEVLKEQVSSKSQADVIHTIHSKFGCKMELQTNESRVRCKSMLGK